MEVLGVAEAWVFGGDQGQLGKAGKLDSFKFHFKLGCYYQFCGSSIQADPVFSGDICHMNVQCVFSGDICHLNVQCVKELTMVQLSVGMATGAAYLGSKVAGHYLPR